MMIRLSVNMRTALWVVLLAVWGIYHGGVQGAPHNPGPQRENNKDPDNVPPLKAKPHKFQDIVESWHKGPDDAEDRYPVWNPLLVGLIRGYLASQKTRKVGLPGNFIKQFKYFSKGSTSTTADRRDLPKRNKKQKLKLQHKDLESKHGNYKRVKREAYQGESGLLTESLSKRDETVPSGSQVLVGGEDRQRLFYDTAEDLYAATDFKIPLHDPRDQPLGRDMFSPRNKFGYIFHPFNQVSHHPRMKRDTYDANYRSKSYYANNGNGYSSYPKFSDPFHPLAYPMKESSYSPDATVRKSVLHPFDSGTGFFKDDSFYPKRKKNSKRFQQMKGSAKNFDFFERPYRSSSSRYSGNSYRRSNPRYSRNSYGNSGYSGNRYGGSSSFSDSSFSNSGFGFPDLSDSSFSNFGNGFNNQKSLFTGDAKTSLNGLSSNVDLTSLAALYGNLFGNTANTAAGNMPGVAPRVNPVAQTPATDRVVDPIGAAPTVPMPSPPVTQAMATQPPVTMASPVTMAPLTLAVTTNPCDAFLTSPSSGAFTTPRPCYYVPRTGATTTGQPTTTTCYDTHGTGQVYPHYHPTKSPLPYDSEHIDEPAWSEFEIISKDLWEDDPHRVTVTSPNPILLSSHNRHFLLTPRPTVSRFITSPSPHHDGLSENIKIAPEILDLTGQFYPSTPHKAPRITGTIEIKREKNKKPSFLVKLPFDTGKLPFAIKRLILSRFTDWPRTKGARNLASVTMDPLCSPGNITCMQQNSLNIDGKTLDKSVNIIAEVDPALFDKERLRQAFLKASSGRTHNALDLEEMDPSLRQHLIDIGEQGAGPRGLSEGDPGHPATRYLQPHEPLGAQEPGDQDDDDTNGGNRLGQLSEEAWQNMMSPSTSNPLWAGANDLPSETPGWLRGIINRFTKEKNWGANDGNIAGEDGDVVPRLLPALEGYDLNNHIETLPSPSHLRQSSGTHREAAGVLHWWIMLAFILSYLSY